MLTDSNQNSNSGIVNFTFDTHAFIKDLVATGVSEAQAEVFSDSFQKVYDSQLKELSTKQDIKNTENVLRQEIQENNVSLRQEIQENNVSLRQEIQENNVSLRQEMHEMKVDLIKWVVGISITMLIAQLAMTTMLLNFMLR